MTSIQFTVVVEGAGMPKQMPGLTAAARAGLVALAFIVAAPASGAADPKARYGDTMVIGITGDPGTLNGTTSSNFVEKIIASNVFSMLIRLDRNFKPVPDLAKIVDDLGRRPHLHVQAERRREVARRKAIQLGRRQVHDRRGDPSAAHARRHVQVGHRQGRDAGCQHVIIR
jgi:hypothetical protein